MVATEAFVHRVLVIDDDASIRAAVDMILRYEGYAVVLAADGSEGLAHVRGDDALDAVLCDIKMPGMDGLEVLQGIHALRPSLPVIMVSGHASISTAVSATRNGAWDFIEKPLDRDRLLLALRNALANRELGQTTERLARAAAGRHEIVGSAPCVQALRTMIARIADSDARVLISGENGSGKELVAQNLHLLSSRRDKPFVDVNCAALPNELIENELFGHERGSYTGAEQRRAGKFELAEGGTLFLDEVADMPLQAQAKVLRVLEEGRVSRIGASDSIALDCRVVAASNKDLQAEVAAGRFREDLYYRLAVVEVQVPPLRDRGDDVVELFTRFLAHFAKRYARTPPRPDVAVCRWLTTQRWPGNVRELRNLAERTILLCNEPTLQLADVNASTPLRVEPCEDVFAIDNFEAFKDSSEKQWLLRKLRENGWNIKRTAELLGMQRSNLYKKMERYALHPPR
ncbi:MAG: sigma-54-dependent Fis family transcriptional regulator [Planctomycetes bacterium]|nr:sigma-54-dependent Fis family transcriptional regulator [Planctomycetota bacterium]